MPISGLFVQDRWTRSKMTLNYGLRYDYFNSSYPEQHIGPTTLAPTRNITFPAQPGLGTLHDLSPRLGAAYDLFGDGKTAIKASVNRYVLAMGPDVSFIQLANPSRNLVTNATRTWNDANRNYVPECDLLNVAANGECGALSNENFGTVVTNLTYDTRHADRVGKAEFQLGGLSRRPAGGGAARLGRPQLLPPLVRQLRPGRRSRRRTGGLRPVHPHGAE